MPHEAMIQLAIHNLRNLDDLDKHTPPWQQVPDKISKLPLEVRTTKKPSGRPLEDPRTGKNRQYIINGTIYVPVIDYSMERLGIRTTTTPLPILTTDASALRTVAKNIDLNNIDKGDWLAFETAAGGRQVEDTVNLFKN
ncbi:unnamed protein product [Colias eurytheme]|nr:unnamed protein product [Colias eurytheme]